MSNVIDYVTWRGDLSFSKSKFNYIDVLALSQLTFLDLSDCVVSDGNQTLKDCANKYFKDNPDGKPLSFFFPAGLNELFKCVGASKRFSLLKLSNYVRDYDHDCEMQFSAMTLDSPRIRTKIVVFSGTDDTFVGWKENFNLIYKEFTLAQKRAIDYLNEVAQGYDGKIIVLGHSKGGHLSIYASAYCNKEIQERIVKVYNVDGPGIPNKEEAEIIYSKLSKKLTTIIPQTSVVGRLFEQGGKLVIAHSEAFGLPQHDCLTWQVEGAKLVLDKERSPESIGAETCIKEILANMTPQQREDFVETIFQLLFSSGATTFTDLPKKWLAMVGKYFMLAKEQKSAVNGPIGKLLLNKHLRKCVLDSLKSFKKDKKKEPSDKKKKEPEKTDNKATN